MRCKTLALTLALLLTAALLGACSVADPADAATGETSTDETAATGETAEDPYAYLADFDRSALFDDKGYVQGVTALDYVTLPEGYTALELPAGTDTVNEDDLDGLIEEEVLSYFMEQEQVTDRAAEMGDTVNIDYVGTLDGVEFEGGNTQGNGTTLQLTGSNYIDDFEQQIAGHTPGDTFDVVVTFPDPYDPNPDLAGKEAKFETTLNYIVEQTLPELTDDFVAENLAADIGCETVKELRDYFRKQMLYSQMANAVYAKMDEGVVYADELPALMTDYFADWALYTPWQYATMYGVGLEEFLTQNGYDSVDAYLEQMQDSITINTQQILLTQAMAEDLGITCDSDELEANAPDIFGTDDLDALRESYGEGYLKMSVLEHMTVDKVLENASFAKE